MNEIEKKVKDKAMFYWLDIEITVLHIYLYWLFAIAISQTWATSIAGIMTIISLIYIAKVLVKLNTLKENV